jgi:hypothetical protein
MPKSVLALGLDPVFADFTQLPGLTPGLIKGFIDSQLERLRGLGYEVHSCLVDLGETAEAVARTRSSRFRRLRATIDNRTVECARHS